MRYIKREKIRVPEDFRLPGTDIIVEAGDVLEVSFSEKKKKEADDEADDQKDDKEMDDEDEDEDEQEEGSKKKKYKK